MVDVVRGAAGAACVLLQAQLHLCISPTLAPWHQARTCTSAAQARLLYGGSGGGGKGAGGGLALQAPASARSARSPSRRDILGLE
jgi:hypothetical protein